MKTSKNLNQIAKVTFASVTFLFASLMPMQAASDKNTALDQLAMINNEIEKAVAFNAPALSEESEAFELFAAESMLDDMFTTIARDAAYVSPTVIDNIETAEAMENLDKLNAQIEQSVKYTPASIAE